MVTKYDLIEWVKRNGEKQKLAYDKENDKIIDLERPEIDIPTEKFLKYLSKVMHCDFDCIYSDVLGNVVLRCNECGAIIFTNDEEDYDPNLCCPVCGEYDLPKSCYWTQEEINADSKKQEHIEWYKKDMERQQAYDEWYEKRKKKFEAKGKHYLFADELLVFEKLKNNKGFCIRLKVNNLYYHKLQNLHIEWCFMTSEDGFSYAPVKIHIIPLSLYSIYFYWIFPHTKKYKELINHH